MSSSGWIGVDLDGTLAMYDGWQGPEHIGEPIPLMVERVKQWRKEGKEVRVFTARVSTKNHDEFKRVCFAIHDWTQKHIGEMLSITNEKDYGMIELWDDRAVAVVPNTGVRIGAPR